MDRQRQRRDRHCPNASLTTSSIFYIYYFSFFLSESEHQNEVLRQEMSTMYQGQPQTYPPPPPPLLLPIPLPMVGAMVWTAHHLCLGLALLPRGLPRAAYSGPGRSAPLPTKQA